MFKKIALGVVALTLVASPAFASRFSSGGSFGGSHSSFSSGSSYSSHSSYSTPSSPRFSSGSTYQSAPASSSPRFSSGSTYQSTPMTGPKAQPTYRQSSPSYGGYNGGYRGPVTVNHNYNYGGGYGYHNGGIMNSPWFWMWMMDRPHNQVVYTNGNPEHGAQSGYGPQQPDILGAIIAFTVQILILIAMGFGIWWLLRKFVFKKKTKTRFSAGSYN